MLHETRFGAKPSTPAKLKAHNNTKTPRKMPPTPRSTLPRSNSSRLVQKVVSENLGITNLVLMIVFSRVLSPP